MYGTVARFRIKPGSEGKLQAQFRDFEKLNIPGYKGSTLYRLDSGDNEYYMTVIFDSKDAYTKNADDPAQDTRYKEMLAIMEGEPEWHDGEIVYSGP